MRQGLRPHHLGHRELVVLYDGVGEQAVAHLVHLLLRGVGARGVEGDVDALAHAHGLHALGFEGVTAVRVGKRIEVTLDVASKASAEQQVAQMCDRLLANAVIEDYEFTVSEVARA